jgi:hypothetical protein
MNKTNIVLTKEQSQAKKRELSRILSAAVINSKFRALLLSDPNSAIKNGYLGECFSLNPADQEKLGAIQANSLADFAAQLAVI